MVTQVYFPIKMYLGALYVCRLYCICQYTIAEKCAILLSGSETGACASMI